MRRAHRTPNHSVKTSHRASGHIQDSTDLTLLTHSRRSAAVISEKRRIAASSTIGDEALALLTQAFDRQPDPVAGLQELRRLEAHADPRGCPGRDDVAW